LPVPQLNNAYTKYDHFQFKAWRLNLADGRGQLFVESVIQRRFQTVRAENQSAFDFGAFSWRADWNVQLRCSPWT